MGGKEAARLRISPEVIVGDVWAETRPARYTAQGFLGLGIGLFEAVAFAPLAARWALPVGAAAGLAAGGFANGSSLLRMRAERKGRRGGSMEGGLNDGGQRRADEIEAGSWICASSVVAQMERRHREQEQRAEREFEAAVEVFTREQKEYERLVAAGVTPEGRPRHPAKRPSPPPPTATYRQVVAIRRSGAEVEIAWRARGRDVTRVAPDEPFHCRDRPTAAGDRHKPAASALSALMRVVPEDADDGMDEAELLITLKAAGHAEDPVRQALRGALAWGLVEPSTLSFTGKAHAAVTLFHRREAPQPARRVSLTPAGEVWAFADGRDFA